MTRPATLALLAAAALGAGAVVLLSAEPANADRVLGTASTSAAVITHGDWQRLPDAGFRYMVCGNTTLVGQPTVKAPLEFPCTYCEPGAWANAPATCVAAWRTANGL